MQGVNTSSGVQLDLEFWGGGIVNIGGDLYGRLVLSSNQRVEIVTATLTIRCCEQTKRSKEVLKSIAYEKDYDVFSSLDIIADSSSSGVIPPGGINGGINGGIKPGGIKSATQRIKLPAGLRYAPFRISIPNGLPPSFYLHTPTDPKDHIEWSLSAQLLIIIQGEVLARVERVMAPFLVTQAQPSNRCMIQKMLDPVKLAATTETSSTAYSREGVPEGETSKSKSNNNNNNNNNKKNKKNKKTKKKSKKSKLTTSLSTSSTTTSSPSPSTPLPQTRKIPKSHILFSPSTGLMHIFSYGNSTTAQASLDPAIRTAVFCPRIAGYVDEPVLLRVLVDNRSEVYGVGELRVRLVRTRTVGVEEREMHRDKDTPSPSSSLSSLHETTLGSAVFPLNVLPLSSRTTVIQVTPADISCKIDGLVVKAWQAARRVRRYTESVVLAGCRERDRDRDSNRDKSKNKNKNKSNNSNSNSSSHALLSLLRTINAHTSLPSARTRVGKEAKAIGCCAGQGGYAGYAGHTGKGIEDSFSRLLAQDFRLDIEMGLYRVGRKEREREREKEKENKKKNKNKNMNMNKMNPKEPKPKSLKGKRKGQISLSQPILLVQPRTHLVGDSGLSLKQRVDAQAHGLFDGERERDRERDRAQGMAKRERGREGEGEGEGERQGDLEDVWELKGAMRPIHHRRMRNEERALGIDGEGEGEGEDGDGDGDGDELFTIDEDEDSGERLGGGMVLSPVTDDADGSEMGCLETQSLISRERYVW